MRLCKLKYKLEGDKAWDDAYGLKTGKRARLVTPDNAYANLCVQPYPGWSWGEHLPYAKDTVRPSALWFHASGSGRPTCSDRPAPPPHGPARPAPAQVGVLGTPSPGTRLPGGVWEVRLPEGETDWFRIGDFSLITTGEVDKVRSLWRAAWGWRARPTPCGVRVDER
jgi:hypothetical protein